MTSKIPDAPLASPEKVNPEKFKCQTFLITLSPKGDITQSTIDEFCKYIQKKCSFWFVVTEVGDHGKKHLHCCCVWSHGVDRCNIHDYWSKKLTKDYPGSIGKFACKVTTQYNHKWYDEYLRKGGDIVLDNYPRDQVTEYFPSSEQQAVLIEIKGSKREASVHVADMLLAYWIDKAPDDSSYESAISTIKYRMYVDNLTPYYIDDRKLHQLCWFLYEKRNQICEPNVADRNYAAIKSGNSIVH